MKTRIMGSNHFTRRILCGMLLFLSCLTAGAQDWGLLEYRWHLQNQRYKHRARMEMYAPPKEEPGKRNNWDRLHLNIDWQMNFPVSCDFADKASGWGMNFEGKYDIRPQWSVGLFLNFHTNHRYVERQTISLDRTASLTTDRQESAFQLPFGASVAYNFTNKGYVRPYIGVKAGAMYQRNSTYNDLYRWHEEPWGFYASPEVGMYIHPVPTCRLGFHVAAYYSYATNKTDMPGCSQDGRNALGLRVGVCF